MKDNDPQTGTGNQDPAPGDNSPEAWRVRSARFQQGMDGAVLILVLDPAAPAAKQGTAGKTYGKNRDRAATLMAGIRAQVPEIFTQSTWTAQKLTDRSHRTAGLSDALGRARGVVLLINNNLRLENAELDALIAEGQATIEAVLNNPQTPPDLRHRVQQAAQAFYALVKPNRRKNKALLDEAKALRAEGASQAAQIGQLTVERDYARGIALRPDDLVQAQARAMSPQTPPGKPGR